MDGIGIELNRRLQDELAEIDDIIAQNGVDQDEAATRVSIDKRRQLFAEYEQTLIDVAIARELDNLPLYKTDPVISEFIQLWCDQLRSIEFRPIYLSDREYCDRFVDCYLPKSWNWQTDFILLINVFDPNILEVLEQRGQKNVIILNTKVSIKVSLELKEKFATFWEISGLDQLEYLLEHYPLKVSNVCHIDCLGSSEPEITDQRIQAIVKERVYLRQLRLNTMGKHGEKWAVNFANNLPNLCKLSDISALSFGGTKTAVVVSPGPSLERNVKFLKDVQDSVVIISPMRSVPILQNAGIDPDFVVQLDSIGNGFAKNSEQSIIKPIRHLVLSAVVDPEFFDFPCEKRHYFFSACKTFELENYGDVGKFDLDGESVSIVCLRLALSMGFDNIAVIGQDLAFDSEKRYAEGGGLDFMPTGCLAADVLVDGYYGGKVATSADYDYFINAFSELAEKSIENNITLFNCTEGGAMIPNFVNKPLKEFLADVDVSSFKFFFEGGASSFTGATLCGYIDKEKRPLIEVRKIIKKIQKIEKNAVLTQREANRRDKLIKKMTEVAENSSYLKWALQDLIMNSQSLTFRAERVTDLSTFLLEMDRITGLLIKGLNKSSQKLKYANT